MEKEINDIFEFLLLRSGRLMIYTSNDRQPIVLDNVPFIDKKEAAVMRHAGGLASAGAARQRGEMRGRVVRMDSQRWCGLRDSNGFAMLLMCFFFFFFFFFFFQNDCVMHPSARR